MNGVSLKTKAKNLRFIKITQYIVVCSILNQLENDGDLNA